MNTQKLKRAEDDFLLMFPSGFSDPSLVELAKKHYADLRKEQAAEYFSEEAFAVPHIVVENIVKLISRSSLVSRFEKPRFKHLINNLTDSEREDYAFALYEQLHGNQEKGFETIITILQREKMAKWPLLTIIPYYYRPSQEIFVKPTTVKAILASYEFDNIQYRPLPSYAFYQAFKTQILAMKQQVSPSIGEDSAAFTWFLMKFASQE